MTLPVASAQVKSAVLLAGCTRAAKPSSASRIRPATTPSACSRRSAGRSGSRRAWRALSGGHTPARHRCGGAGGFFVGGVLPGRGERGAGLRPAAARGRHEPAPHRPADGAADDGRRHQSRKIRASRAAKPVADLRVRHAPLHGIDVPEALVPDMIDEFPALFVAAALRRGHHRDCAAPPSCGSRNPTGSRSWRAGCATSAHASRRRRMARSSTAAHCTAGNVDSHGDHRIAMSLAVAAQCASDEVRIVDCANVATSFPGFPRIGGMPSGLGLEARLIGGID